MAVFFTSGFTLTRGFPIQHKAPGSSELLDEEEHVCAGGHDHTVDAHEYAGSHSEKKQMLAVIKKRTIGRARNVCGALDNLLYGTQKAPMPRHFFALPILLRPA